ILSWSAWLGGLGGLLGSILPGSGGAGAPLSCMHWRNSSIFCRSAAERFGPRKVMTPTPAPPGAGAVNDCVCGALFELLLSVEPLSASETAASPTAVIPAARSERPSGPRRIVIDLLFFIFTTPSSVDSRHRGLRGMKPVVAERRLR